MSSQNKIQQNKNKKFKAFFSLCLLFFIIFLIFGYNNIPVVAEEKPGEYKTEILEPKRSKILVGDPITGKAVLKNTAKFYYTKVKDWAIDKAWKELKESGDVLWRKALKNFLDTLAYDAATYIVTGDKGQAPMFQTKGFNAFLQNVKDNVAGEIIEGLGKSMGFSKFNVCEPDLNVKMKIGFGLVQTNRPDPPKPKCTWKTMKDNWNKSIKKLKDTSFKDFIDISVTSDKQNILREIGAHSYADEYKNIIYTIQNEEIEIRELEKNNKKIDTDKFVPKLDLYYEQIKLLKENVKNYEALGVTDEQKGRLDQFYKGMDELSMHITELRNILLGIKKDESKKFKDISSPDFLQNFQNSFNPEESDIGAALTVQTGLDKKLDEKLNTAVKDRVEGGGVKPVTDPIAGDIKTPAKVVEESYSQAIKDSTASEKIQTGSIVADSISLFFNTLASKLMKKVFTGLLEKAPEEKKTNWKDLADINNPNASPTKEGVAGARERFKGIGKSDFTVRGDYNILAELTICPDPTKAGPTNCVITSNFSTAIGEKKTVAEAIDAGDLNPNAVFGFSAAGSEPAYLEGYPYRSMIILRKFRILPVGWELAAQYIKDAATTTDNALATDKTLGDMVACFDEYDDHTGFYAHWCKGLVDPNWVLKAPLNYCKRSGPGPEILSETIMGEQNDSQLAISRNDAYCADEQSCIKESSDGTCHLYGYCTEERRMWNFNTKSCEPKYNTCRTFKGEQDQVVSYLENTLNYGECSIDNIGCQAYCADYATSTQKFTCTYNSGNKIHLDKDVEACEQANEGCHEFIRPKAGLGVNLLINSSFEQGRDSWIFNPSENGATTTIDTNEVYKNKQSLKIYAPNSVSYTNVQQYIYGIVSDELITVSYYVKTELINGPHKGAWLVVYARNNNFFLNDPSTGNHWIEKSVLTEDHQGIGEWERVSFSFVTPPQTNNLIIEPRIQAATGTAYFDAIKVESGEDATEYSDYGNKKDLIYQKYAPTYLGCDKENAPSECDKYVINCKEDEVGCELYTSVKDEIKIPAQVKVKDYCPAGCVGYNIYFQGQTTFDFLRDNYFIPTTAKTCSAEAVGCDEFTNLDELKKGGEAKEYYSYLRQCIRPDKDQCVEFYSWEGSGETGYQLKVVNLQKETVNGPNNNGPKVTEDDSAICNKEIYKLPSYDPMYQPNCRQFYNRAGAEFYHLVNNTISCSDNCHPYRRTAVSDDPTIVSETACASTSGSVDKYWDKDNEQCLVCKNNGVWNNQQSACIYMAIPGQGAVCSAEQNNCREYIGNTGDNVEFVFNYDFEGSMEDWIGIGGATAAVSNEAPITGGKSLFISGDNSHKVGVIVGDAVRLDAAYVLSFVAKKDIAGSDKIITVTLTDGAYTSTFAVAKLYNDTEWHSYKINLDSLGHKPVKDIEKLIMQANSNFYLDNIRLTEVVENYYLIKNSWATPSVCNEDHDNKPSPLYMLGCEAYYDRDDKTHNLLSFSSLCAESVVGCELMIDTQNSSDYKQETFNASDATSTIRVPADSVKYIIYDKNRQCNADDKGCQRLGKPYQYDQSLLYSDVYLKNNPNKYNEILCSSGATDCKEWSSGDGLTYFKDPGNMLCEWRQKANSGTGGWGWYKKKIKRCDDGNRSICLTDKDCISPGTCKLETEDNACSVSSLKTFGTGGVRVEQPKDNWVGLCEASSVGCSEYIDPISRFNTNLLSGSNSSQKISLKQNTLYLLARQKDTGSITINCSEDVYVLGNDNKLSLNKANNVIIVQDISDTRSSELFYISDNDVPCTCTISGNKIELKKVELKKAIVDYQLKENLSEGDCGGMVGFERNCILFNERTQSGKNLVALKYDADKTYIDGPKGASPSETSGENDSNVIIKVSPDRVCNKWLACTKIKQVNEVEGGVCESMGICSKLDDKNNCSQWASITKQNQTFPNTVTTGDISNMSGYAKVGYTGYPNKVSFYPNNYYPLSMATTTGLGASVLNGGFELAYNIDKIDMSNPNDPKIPLDFDDVDQPFYWRCDPSALATATACEVIDDPVESQKEGKDFCFRKNKNGTCYNYAPEGKSFLKLTADHAHIPKLVSQYNFSVDEGKEYILTAYVNTKNLSSGKAQIKINNSEVMAIPSKEPWKFRVSTIFKPTSPTINITLTAYENSQGSYYFDDIKIRPTLNSADLANGNKWYTPQTCRLYPKEDSLSCEYYDDSGVRYKGWSGYCLEYDRYPGSPDTCLLWWSVPYQTGQGDRINEWCGDKFVNGEEECECGKGISGTPGSTNCNTDTGKNMTDQYKCVNCNWVGGWCGDNVIQSENGEHCDHNDYNAGASDNLYGSQCWHNNNIATNIEFQHDDYNEYLSGDLGCYDSSSEKKCKFDISDCSDKLVNKKHTRKDCADKGGVVWALNDADDTKGYEVTEQSGKIRDDAKKEIGNNKIYFCRLSGANCGAGWTQYYNWSTTSATSCNGRNTDDGCGGDCNGYDCTTRFHNIFQNLNQETCSYANGDKGSWCRCDNWTDITCTASILVIGCY